MKRYRKLVGFLLMTAGLVGCQKVDEAKNTITSIAQQQASLEQAKTNTVDTTVTTTAISEDPLAFSYDELIHKVFSGTAKTKDNKDVPFQMNFNLMQIKDALNPTAPTLNNVLLADAQGNSIIGNGKFEQINPQTVKLSGRNWTSYERAAVTISQIKKGQWQVKLNESGLVYTTATVSYDEEKTAQALKDASQYGQRMTPYGFASTKVFTESVKSIKTAQKAVEKIYNLKEDELTGQTKTVNNQEIFIFTVDKQINGKLIKEIVVVPETGEYFTR
ncbi:hypothetical protein EsVE80_02200 [Enterococcus saigonensis]|uniref:Lipoprotein n=1 Tax=Enterococcus saigonensis TaxID=1805431 RepID=A0A679IP00_9ENTE|nr:hypothetical protein [Enterococcus saigonensis]BCA84697.1 hypothetical protein EsVE80_02200 [Enterococcus saigonensis]